MENFKKFYIDGQWVDPQSSTTFPLEGLFEECP